MRNESSYTVIIRLFETTSALPAAAIKTCLHAADPLELSKWVDFFAEAMWPSVQRGQADYDFSIVL